MTTKTQVPMNIRPWSPSVQKSTLEEDIASLIDRIDALVTHAVRMQEINDACNVPKLHYSLPPPHAPATRIVPRSRRPPSSPLVADTPRPGPVSPFALRAAKESMP